MGNYPFTAELFVLFGFSCFAYVERTTVQLLGQIQTSQTGGQLYSDTSPYGKCSLVKLKNEFQRIVNYFMTEAQ